MSTGSTLIELSELDLALARDEKALKELPELAELAKKRRLYLKLKAEEKQLFAERKDIETDFEELAIIEKRCDFNEQLAHRETDPTDRESVKELELELSLIAKERDKVAFKRREAQEAMAEHEKKEAKLNAYIEALETAIKDETRTAREKAAKIQSSLDGSRARRERLAGALAEGMIARYERAQKRFGGLAVERLVDEVPSICRTRLQSSSLTDLKRGGEVAECPYCHRILIVSEEE